MPSDSEILQRIQQAFAECRRPKHFGNFLHCEECAEYDEVLRSHDVTTLGIEDVGIPGSDPICFISPEGFAYFLPALARLTLAEPDDAHGWYGGTLLWHLCHDGRQNRRLLACTQAQRRAIVELLHHIVETRTRLVESERDTDVLFQAIEIWSDETPVA